MGFPLHLLYISTSPDLAAAYVLLYNSTEMRTEMFTLRFALMLVFEFSFPPLTLLLLAISVSIQHNASC